MKKGIPLSILNCSQSESDVLKGFSNCDKEGYAGNWVNGICPIFEDNPQNCTCDKELRKEFVEKINAYNSPYGNENKPY